LLLRLLLLLLLLLLLQVFVRLEQQRRVVDRDACIAAAARGLRCRIHGRQKRRR
jgi:hypothetical protein